MSIEHQSKHFTAAYDSVPWEALWLALKMLGIPTLVIELIKSFHEGMKAKILVNGMLPDKEIAVDNGLRQGCTMAPTLFNMYIMLRLKLLDAWGKRMVHVHIVGSDDR